MAIVVLAIVSTRVVGRRAARTVDQVTALLERNEARFRAMVRDSNDIMAIVDPHGRLVYASPVSERILGLDIEPLIGTDVFDLIHPDDREAARRGLQLTRDSKEGGDRVEVRLRRSDGTWRTVEAVATSLLDDPSVEGIVISARDLTDRRRAEADIERTGVDAFHFPGPLPWALLAGGAGESDDQFRHGVGDLVGFLLIDDQGR